MTIALNRSCFCVEGVTKFYKDAVDLEILITRSLCQGELGAYLKW